jgi:hypothetical protein
MNPFLMWSRLAWKTGEMAIGSAQVIGHRTSRLALAGPVPSERDQREFALMGQEKSEAAMESAQAVGMRMLTLNEQFRRLRSNDRCQRRNALMSIVASRSATESAGHQSKLVRDTMANSLVAASKLSGATAQLARRALKPVHARVSGNVRRLGAKVK